MRKKLVPKAVSWYEIIGTRVESGVKYGYFRAHKYTNSPSEEQIVHAISEAVMSELCETIKL